MSTNLLIDISNLTHACRHTFKKNEEVTTGLLIHKTMYYILKNYQLFKADGVMIACDSRNVWRKDIYPEYKGNRDHDTDEFYPLVLEAISEMERFFNECTSVPAVNVDRAEADDIIAVVSRYVQVLSPGTKIIILSADKDFVQLINEYTRLYSPIQKKERTTEDAEFDLFVKCIRGDMGDNIFSAFPQVRVTRLQKAYEDPLEALNLMETVTKDNIHVGKAYANNKALIDLRLQPEKYKQAIRDAVDQVIANPGNDKYSFMNATRFLGQYKLIKMIDNLEAFKPLFKSRFSV